MNYVHSILEKCVYAMLLYKTWKHVSSVAVLGDLQALLQPAPCSRESGLLCQCGWRHCLLVLLGNVSEYCICWGAAGEGAWYLQKKKKKPVAHLLLCCDGSVCEFL